ncbi:hypothetical protein G9A89_002307 [Geosiphon pyriformis]|nr:hypothetical protein G9A89_002307 [Geosiphon pyriformis]
MNALPVHKMATLVNKQTFNKNTIKRCVCLVGLVAGPLAWLALVVLLVRNATIKDGTIFLPVQPGVILGLNSTIRYIITFMLTSSITYVLEASLRYYQISSIQTNGLELSRLIKLGVEKKIGDIMAVFWNRPTGLKAVWFWLSVVVLVPYILATADILLHYWVTVDNKLERGQQKYMNNTISLECSDVESILSLDTCVHWQAATGSGLRYPRFISDFRRNATTNIKGYDMKEGIIIMSNLNETIWLGSFQAITIEAKCRPVSRECELSADYGAQTSFHCPKSIYGVEGNIQNVTNVIVPLGTGADYYHQWIPTSAGQSGKLEWLITGQFPYNPSTNYDNEFVQEVHRDMAILLYCNTTTTVSTLFFSMGDWAVRLDYPLDANLTRSVSQGLYELDLPIHFALADASFNGSSQSVALEAEHQLKLGLSAMLGSVAHSGVGGPVTVAHQVVVTRISIPALILYGIALVIIPIIIIMWILWNLRKYTKGFDADGREVVIQSVLAEMLTHTDRLVYDAVAHPSERACLQSVETQKKLLSQGSAGIGHRAGHFGLFNGVVASAEGVVSVGKASDYDYLQK